MKWTEEGQIQAAKESLEACKYSSSPEGRLEILEAKIIFNLEQQMYE